MTDTNTAQLVVDLQATDDAVRANGWVAPGLGVPGAPLGLLGSTLNPLSGLASAGLGWFMPLVSFLGDPLTQLQGGNEASVSSGAQDFGAAGANIAGVASTYRDSTSAQTADWSGTAATEYRDSAAAHADGVAGLGEASNTVGSAIIGAGQVVAQAIAEITELIAEAVAQIVPIMTQAVARAGETFGQSVVEAIPPCVGIAVEYALRIAAKLAALVASGDNLLKLVQGGMAVVELIQQALSSISQQSVSAEAGLGAGADQRQGGGPASTMGAMASGNASGGTGSSSPTSSTGGLGGGASTVEGTFPAGGSSQGVAPQSSGAIPPSLGTAPDASRPAGAGGVSAPGGGGQLGAGAMPGPAATPGPVGGARVDAGQGGRQQPTRAPGGGGLPMGGFPVGGRPASEPDKEHQRKISVIEGHEEDIVAAPPVIPSLRP